MLLKEGRATVLRPKNLLVGGLLLVGFLLLFWHMWDPSRGPLTIFDQPRIDPCGSHPSTMPANYAVQGYADKQPLSTPGHSAAVGTQPALSADQNIRTENGVRQNDSLQMDNPPIDINPEWAGPPEGHCYDGAKQSWEKCAGPHRAFKNISFEEGSKGSLPMCHHKPLCWLDWDWRNTEPPARECTIEPGLQLTELSMHDGVKGDSSSFIEREVSLAAKTPVEVYLCNHWGVSKATKKFNYPYKSCPRVVNLEPDWTVPGREERSQANFQNYATDSHFIATDALMFGFQASMFEHWMSFNKTIIVVAEHRINMGRCSQAESARNFANYRRLAARGSGKPFNILGAFSLYDIEYIRHYTGLTPIYLMGGSFGTTRGVSWTGTRKDILLNGEFYTPPQFLANKDIKMPHQIFTFYNYQDLASCRAVVLIPYSVNNYKFLEQYAMNMPIFAPTVEFATQQQMFIDRVLTGKTYPPYCPPGSLHDEMMKPHPSSPYKLSPNLCGKNDGAKGAEAEKFWIGFSDVYHLPCIQYYSSYEDLLKKLDNMTHADLTAISNCMKQANKWRKAEFLQNWCWSLSKVDQSRKIPKDYCTGIRELYGVDRLLEPGSMDSDHGYFNKEGYQWQAIQARKRFQLHWEVLTVDVGEDPRKLWSHDISLKM